MKKIYLLLIMATSLAANAQVTKVQLQASGLTCSMCSNAINKALKTLDFIAHVEANFKNYSFEISFTPNSTIDFDRIKDKVEGAGFSVASFIASIDFNNIQVRENVPITIGNHSFSFVNGNNKLLNGVQQVKILDKGFISSKEFKKPASGQLSTQAGMHHVSLYNAM